MAKNVLPTKIIMAMLLFLNVRFLGYCCAQEDTSQNHFFRNIPSELASPWTTKARPWFLAGVATTVGLVILEDQVVDPLQTKVSDGKPLGRLSQIGNLGGRSIQNSIYVLGMLGYYGFSRDKNVLKRAGLMAKASLYAGLLCTGLKYGIREPRPNGHDRLSFPSGHTTMAFAFSSYITAEHGLFPYGIISNVFALLTDFSRINDNNHYLHDVVGGMTIGISYGLGVAYSEKKSSKNTNEKNQLISDFNIFPLYSENTKGLFISFRI